MLIRESSDAMTKSSDNELSDWQRDEMGFGNRITHSKDPVDQRLVNLYKIKRAETRNNIEAAKAEELAEESE